jgi:hypothetical protein
LAAENNRKAVLKLENNRNGSDDENNRTKERHIEVHINRTMMGFGTSSPERWRLYTHGV